MRVLHISPSYYPAFRYGGPIFSVHYLNTALVKQGIEVDVITTNAGIEQDIPLQKWVMQDNVRILYTPYCGYEHYNFSIALTKQVLRHIRYYDVVHITAVWNFPVLVGSLASKIYHKPYIISPRGTIYPETVALKSKSAKRLYYFFLAKHCLQNARFLHFTTEDEQQKVGAFLGLSTPSFVIANGIDVAKFDWNHCLMNTEWSGKKYILFFSRIHPKKGLDLLIPAFAKISNDYHDLFLVIAGPDNDHYGEEVERLIGQHNVSGKVILIKKTLLDNEKLDILHNAAMFVLPSYSENFGMSVIEAMACKIPVLISNQVGLYQTVEKYQAGMIVSTTVDSIYQGIKTLQQNPDLCKQFTENGKKLVAENYTVDSTALQMKEKYEQMISANK